jgi:glutamine cyclotransferase
VARGALSGDPLAHALRPPWPGGAALRRSHAAGPLTRVALAAALLAALAAGGRASTSVALAEPDVPTYGVEIVGTRPHDPDAFTQGLVFHDGALYESTGLHGRSSVRRVDLDTGRVLSRRSVPRQYFAEGLTIFQGRIVQLTWQSQKGFVYDLGLRLTREFAYTGEGWGLTHDGTSLIMSDGTSRLRFLDPATFAVRRVLDVTDAGRPVESLNELEFVRGEVYANVWPTDWIVRIDPVSGRVVGRVDLTGLLAPHERHGTEDVANGIAYDASADRLFLTGKLWPRLYEVRLRRR